MKDRNKGADKANMSRVRKETREIKRSETSDKMMNKKPPMKTGGRGK